jgi:hypothetical protein
MPNIREVTRRQEKHFDVLEIIIVILSLDNCGEGNRSISAIQSPFCPHFICPFIHQ